METFSKHRKKFSNDLNTLGYFLFLFLLLFFFLFSFIYRNIEMSRLRYEINQLKQKRMSLYLEVEELRRDFAKQSTVNRIDSIFRERYGSVSLDLGTHITSIKLPGIEKLLLQKPNAITIEKNKNSSKGR